MIMDEKIQTWSVSCGWSFQPYICTGGLFLYQYSEPLTLWFWMVPIENTYMKIATGILCGITAYEILKHNNEYTAFYAIAIQIPCYLVHDFLKHWLDVFLVSLENIFLLVLIVVTYRLMRNPLNLNHLGQSIRNERLFFFYLFIGILPYILSEFVYYSHLSFCIDEYRQCKLPQTLQTLFRPFVPKNTQHWVLKLC